MADIKLLLVEDDKNLAFMEKNTLEDIVGGYEIVTASNGKDGIKAWESFKPDVIISDIDMPIMYEAGVDEYIKKPFVPEELDCHIKALLKFKGGLMRRNVSNCIKIGKHTLDPEHSCLKDEDGIICLKLNKQEAKTLELLAKNKNMIIKREIIQNTLWGSIEKDFYLARRLDVIITSLRKYLQIDPFVQIETTRGVGFSLIESI